MDRRNFLRLCAGAAGVTAATMAEAGFWSEFLSWLTRKPSWLFPSEYQQFVEISAMAEATAATELLPELGPLATIYYEKRMIDFLKTNLRFDSISLPRTFPGGTKAVKFGLIWKPVLETKHGLVVV